MFRKDLMQKMVRRRFEVTCKDGVFFTGILISACPNVFVFADVKVNGQPADGELYIDRVNVAYSQLMVTSETG